MKSSNKLIIRVKATTPFLITFQLHTIVLSNNYYHLHITPGRIIIIPIKYGRRRRSRVMQLP